MTMSVGLGKIQNDPAASILIRKALGALSTPGLLVHDTGLSIDDDGRIIIQLNPNGGIQQDELGLSLSPVPITIGIDSHVELLSEAYDREWNARLTGSAPNYFESGLAIGADNFGTLSPNPAPDIQTTMLNVTSNKVQIRTSYDVENSMSIRTLRTGQTEFFSIGSDPGFRFIGGDGTYENATSRFQIDESGGFQITAPVGFMLNDGTSIEQIFAHNLSVYFAGGGTAGVISWAGYTCTITSPYTMRVGQDHITVCPADYGGFPGTTGPLPNEWLGFSARIVSSTQLALRIVWIGVTAADWRHWIFTIHKLRA